MMYPGQSPKFPAAGMLEEAGELMHALLKNQGQHVWGSEERYANADWHASIVDAIGDCAIYACSLCNALGWDFATLTAHAWNFVAKPEQAFDSVAKLVQIATFIVQDPENNVWTLAYLRQLGSIAANWNLDIRSCIEVTWNKVKERKRASTSNRGTGPERQDDTVPSAATHS